MYSMVVVVVANVAEQTSSGKAKPKHDQFRVRDQHGLSGLLSLLYRTDLFVLVFIHFFLALDDDLSLD